jgi:hypothetical protein
MIIDTHPADSTATPLQAPNGGRLPVAAVIAASLALGIAVALVLILAVFPGATESVVTGCILAAFGVGWAAMAGLSARYTAQPQRWAAVSGGLPGRLGSRVGGVPPAERRPDRPELGLAADHRRAGGLDVRADATRAAG